MADKIQVNRLTNANVYINGVSQLGKAEEISLPVVKQVMTEHKSLGLVGKMEFASGIDKMEAKIKWNSFYSDVFKKFASPFSTLNLQCRSSIERYDSTGRVAQIPYVVYMTAYAKDFPLGNFKAQDNVELESNLSVTYIKIEENGESVLEIDVLANIYKVGGVDQLALYRQNLGID